MAPPPNSGDAKNKNDDDPLGGMDPMAWLESLAARQGANSEEFVTAANLDIPLPPADTVIDEPGYTPGYDVGKSASAKAESAKAELPKAAPAKVEPAKAPTSAQAPEPQPVASTDDPLGGMDPMAWLESLAARQGANSEEFVTAANLDIPLPPPDTVIDEPGYTPGYDVGKSASVKAEPAKTELPKAAPAKAEPIKIEPVKTPEPPQKAEAQPVASTEDPLGGMDPMAWLESLAARQGANSDEFVTAANLDIPLPPADTVIDEPGYVDYDPFGGGSSSRIAAPAGKAEAQPPTPPSEPEPATVGEDPLGGMDPLAWLESLTADQGIGVGEFSGVMDAGSEQKIDYEALIEDQSGAQGMTPMSVEEAAQLLGVDMLGQATNDDPLGGMDPLAWLESLAARQGANPEELITGGTLELPPEPDAEESMGAYSAFAATMDSTSSSMAPESAFSWLEELAREQTQPISAVPTPGEPTPEAISDAGGASDDIEEVKEWLERAAQNLEETRDFDFETQSSLDEIAPAEAADLPSWLMESLSQTSPTGTSTPSFSDEIATPTAPEDLPSWLTQPDAETSLDLANDFLASLQAVSPQSPQSTPLAQPLPAPRYEPVDEDIPTSSELEEMTRAASPEEIDPWAEALDWEYERREAGDESVPDWYLEAIARSEEVQEEPQLGVVTGQSPAAVETPSSNFETDFAQAASTLPDWLSESSSGDQTTEAVQGEIPDWLKTISPGTFAETLPPIPQATTDDWLRGTSDIEAADLPEWLTARPEDETLKVPSSQAPVQTPPKPPEPPVAAPAPAPAPRAEPQRSQESVQLPQPTAAVTPQPRPEPRVQPQPQPQPQRQTAQVARPAAAYSGDHGETLRRAREHLANNRIDDSLAHYQQLIDHAGLLEETRGDLRQLTEQNPSDPRLNRMLGDTHMRLGDLQEALNTYRKALDQL